MITFITYHIVILYAVVEALYQHRSTVLSCFMLCTLCYSGDLTVNIFLALFQGLTHACCLKACLKICCSASLGF